MTGFRNVTKLGISLSDDDHGEGPDIYGLKREQKYPIYPMQNDEFFKNYKPEKNEILFFPIKPASSKILRMGVWQDEFHGYSIYHEINNTDYRVILHYSPTKEFVEKYWKPTIKHSMSGIYDVGFLDNDGIFNFTYFPLCNIDEWVEENIYDNGNFEAMIYCRPEFKITSILNINSKSQLCSNIREETGINICGEILNVSTPEDRLEAVKWIEKFTVSFSFPYELNKTKTDLMFLYEKTLIKTDLLGHVYQISNIWEHPVIHEQNKDFVIKDIFSKKNLLTNSDYVVSDNILTISDLTFWVKKINNLWFIFDEKYTIGIMRVDKIDWIPDHILYDDLYDTSEITKWLLEQNLFSIKNELNTFRFVIKEKYQ